MASADDQEMWGPNPCGLLISDVFDHFRADEGIGRQKAPPV